jgi:hypothetical protein
MKFRDLRTFTVEHKSKRRPTSAPPASIWGNATGLFRTTSDQASTVVSAPIDKAPPAPATTTEAHADGQVRRILPDLRAPQVEMAEEVVAIPVKPRRAPRKGRETEQRDADKQSAHQIESPSTTPDIASMTAPTIVAEAVALAGADDTPRAPLTSEPRADIVVTQEQWSAMVHAPEAALLTHARRERTWTRKVDDLARGERWKRRLPEVCR